MATETKIKTACPVCGMKYKVPTSSTGHSAKCAKCQTKFRIKPYEANPTNTRLRRPPTEDDILSWLNDARYEDEDYDIPREHERILNRRESLDASINIVKHTAS